MPHRYLRQHQPFLLLLLLLPHIALIHPSMKNSLSLHAILIHLAISSHSSNEQRQGFFLLLQLHLQTLVLLLHLGQLLWDLVLLLMPLLVVIGMDYTAEDRLFIRNCASSLLFQVEGRRIHNWATLLSFLLELLHCLQGFLPFCCLLLCLFRLTQSGVVIIIQIQQWNISEILQALFAINYNITLLSDNIRKLPILQGEYLHQRYIPIQHQIRLRLPSFALIQ